MPRDKTESHAKILAAAKKEFMEEGFEKASMRRIAARCGMTAAGLYRHCRDKEDLFDLVVNDAVKRMDDWLSVHISGYLNEIQKEEQAHWRDSIIDMMKEIIYPNMAEYHLLIAKSKGTRYEHILHDMTEKAQEKMLEYMPMIREQGYPAWDIRPEELHLLLSAYVTALFEPVVHNYTMEEAVRCLDTVEAFFLPGWKQLMGF